eukprot:6821192-Pyramimonas_sp.AAC.1
MLYRSLSRALTFLANQVYPGWAFTSLDAAVPSFVAQFTQLTSHPSGEPCCCRGSGRCMVSPGLVVGDAGQAYEAIALDRIYDCLDRLFDQLEPEKKQRCVTVMRAQRSHVFFGGGADQRLWDRTVWFLKSIRRALEGFLGMRLFVICGLVVQQVRGIPIG